MSENETNATAGAPAEPAAAAATTPAPAKSGNGLGIAALILGILAMIVAFIPLVGIFLIWVPALVGIALGITALVKKNAKKILAIIGLALSVIAIPVGIATFAAGVAGVSSAIDEAVEESKVSEVIYTVEGDGGTASVTYTAYVDGVSTSKSEDVTLPWTLTVNPESNSEEFSFDAFTISASSGGFGTGATVNLSCKITADGEVVSESSDSAEMPMVSCFG